MLFRSPRGAGRPARTLALVVVASLVTATLSLLTGAAAGARPQVHRTIAQVSALLDRLGRQNEALDESYNQAVALVQKQQRRARAADRAAHAAAADAVRARNRLAMAAAQRYESGNLGSTGMLLTSENPQGYLNDLSSLDYLSAQFATLSTQAVTSSTRAHTAAHRAAVQLAAARTKARALHAQRATLMARAHHYRGVLASLTAAQQRRYALARQAALAKAQAEARAQARAAAAQARAAKRTAPVHANTPIAAPVTTPVGTSSAAVQRVIDFAEAQVGKAYQYTGTGPYAYDCSGLTMMSWRQAGVYLPHQSAAQYNVGTHVSYDDLQPGDLIFLYHPISHVEIYVGHDLAVSAADPATGVVYVHPSQDMGDYVGATRP